jgi:hypothetical protein
MRGFWGKVERQASRRGRHERQLIQRRIDRHAAISRRVHYTKESRFAHQRDRTMYTLNTMSKRRAIMLQPTGICSPVVLLPSTKNARGVIGSFLGGDARVIAYRDVSGGSRLVVFCVNDEICDDCWCPQTYDILKRMQFKMMATEDTLIYGNALVVRLCEESGIVYIGDVVISEGIPLSLYCKQVESAEDTS